MFEFITHPLLKIIVESRIKSSFTDNDENKTRLKQWLAVAHDGQFNAQALNYKFDNGKSLVDYGLDRSNDFLVSARINPPWYERLIIGKSYRNRSLLNSQTYYKSTLEIYKNIAQPRVTEELELSWYHRFINWCISASGFKWEFNSTDFNNDEFSAKLRAHEGIEEGSRDIQAAKIANEPTSTLKIETPAIREKYSVAKLLSAPNIILKRMSKTVETEETDVAENISLKDNTPAHMQQWLTSIRLNQSVDHTQQHTVQQEQDVNANVVIQDLQRIQETTRWTDDSQLHDLSVAETSLKELKYEASEMWIRALNRACGKEWEANISDSTYIYAVHKMQISAIALDKLVKAKGHVRTAIYPLDLDSLPLGFFIDKNDEGDTFTLKYNEKYRLHQLATLRDAAVRLDVNNPASDFELDSTTLTCLVTKNDLMQTLKARHIHLKQRHLDFLEKLDSETHNVKFKGAREEAPRTETKAYAFRALQMMAEAIYPLPTDKSVNEEQQDPFLSEFIDILETYAQFDTNALTGSSSYYYYENTCITNYLNKFILNYLKGITNGKEYYADEVRDALKRYATLNRNEYMWLEHIESANERYNLNFSETSKGLFYFFDYFASLGVPVPECNLSLNGASALGGFIQLKHILDCISLSGNGKNILAKQFQALYTANIPKYYDVVKQALKAGYAFVHESMLFGLGGGYVYHDYDHDAFDLHIVTREEFKQLKYGSSSMPGLSDTIYFRAMYLRFISYNVDPQYFQEALNKWGEMTSTYLTSFAGSSTNGNGTNDIYVLNAVLQNQWHELQQYALSLPSVMAANKQQTTEVTANDVPEAFINKKEALLQSEKAYSTEHIDTLFAKIAIPEALQKEIAESIQKINALTKQYALMSEDDLQTALKSIKASSLEERIAILRETHCRLTCSHSKANPPQGEWLRLEQLVSVLIAMKEEALLQIDTGEGKTFILQLIALLKALDGNKGNVLTHNESLALDAGDKIKKLAHFVGIKTAKKTDSAASILNADIVYIDISAAVINDLLAKQSTEATLPGKRQASFAIIDEVDNIVIDIHANTTMQISRGGEEADAILEQFLNLMNRIVRTDLPAKKEMTEKDAQRNFVRTILNQELKDNQFYKTKCSNDDDLDKYIRAAISAATLKRDTHYVVENDDLVINDLTIARKVVHIMHKDTTGRADKLSQWGEGIHQFVAAFEKQNNNATIVIPGISEVVAEGNIDTYLNENYSSRVGVTATMGNEQVRDKIDAIIGANLNVVIPRAIRPLGIEANWPLKRGEPEYNRCYRFPPIHKNSESSHYATLLEAIQNIQESNQSCIIFWNTISECDAFFEYLKQNNISTLNIQILDDTHDEEKDKATGSFHPSEATIITRAKEARMITLTTAAGSRGTDFDDINVGILAKPNLGRVTVQKAGRIARNAQFGQVYEIYNIHDLDTLNNIEAVDDNKKDPMGHRSRVLEHEKAKEDHTLKAIEQRGSKTQARSIFKGKEEEVKGKDSSGPAYGFL